MVPGNSTPTLLVQNLSRWMKAGAILSLALLLPGCTYGAGHTAHNRPWFLGFSAPAYMDVWLETADVVDIQERVFRRAGAGIVSISMYENRKNLPRAEGWSSVTGAGAGRQVNRANLPRLIYVRWQSMVEPQTYEAYIVIPESAREIMRKPEKAFCAADGQWITDYRDNFGIGLAPGGIVKVWLGGDCVDEVEIMRMVGTISPRGPYEGLSDGKHRPLTDVSKDYIEKFGVPYGSW